MALREIGAKLTIEGEAEWNAQMNASERQLKNNSSALAALTAEFAGNANSVEALKQKQTLLQSQYDQQKEKVRALTKAVEDSSSLYGENAERTDKLRQSLNYAQAAMAKTGHELDDVNGYLEEAERSADGCATSIDGYGRKVKDAGEETDGLLGSLNKLAPGLDLTALKGNLTGAALAAVFKKAWDWAMNLVESTKEVRAGLEQIQTAAEAAGLTFDDELNAQLRELYTMTGGDLDSSLESLSNLLAADFSGNGLATAVDLLSGAIVRFPDTLKIESLADSLQETLATRDATGQFEELLSRLGVDVESFETALASCTTTAEAHNLVLQMLDDEGLADVKASYETTAANAIALAEAEYDLQMEQAQLAESFVPMKTKLTEVQASWTGFLATLLDSYNTGAGPAALISAGISSGIAAGAEEAGLSMREILDVLNEYGMTMEEASIAAVQAGQSTGEYLNSLAAQCEEQAVATESTDILRDSMASHKTSVEDALVVLEELRLKYEEIRGNIDSAVSGFSNMHEAMANNATDAQTMLDALDSQIEYLNNYQANLKTVANEYGLSDALVEQFSDGSAESAAYLQAIVDDGGACVEELNAKFAEVDTGKQAFVETVAGMLPEFEATLDEVANTLTEAVGDWNKYDEAATAGQNTIDGFTAAIRQNKASVIALGAEIGNAFMSGYNSAMDINSPSRRAGQAMDFTVDGFTEQGEKRLQEFSALGAQMGESFLAGYSRGYEQNAAALRLQAGGYAGAGSQIVSTRTANINLYPQTMDSGMTDYLLRMVNEELGGVV